MVSIKKGMKKMMAGKIIAVKNRKTMARTRKMIKLRLALARR
jgi:hypothetical protein